MQDYTPEFRTDVVVNNPDGTTTPVNPEYCLTDDSAQLLAMLLNDNGEPCGLTEDWPQKDWPAGSPFTQSDKVPYLEFTTDEGVVVTTNAGFIAKYWNQGLSSDVALRNAKMDIENLKKGN